MVVSKMFVTSSPEVFKYGIVYFVEFVIDEARGLWSFRGAICKWKKLYLLCVTIFGTGAVTTWFKDLGQSRPGIKIRSPACEAIALCLCHSGSFEVFAKTSQMWLLVVKTKQSLNFAVFRALYIVL